MNRKSEVATVVLELPIKDEIVLDFDKQSDIAYIQITKADDINMINTIQSLIIQQLQNDWKSQLESKNQALFHCFNKDNNTIQAIEEKGTSRTIKLWKVLPMNKHQGGVFATIE